jgi:hypothetical protein
VGRKEDAERIRQPVEVATRQGRIPCQSGDRGLVLFQGGGRYRHVGHPRECLEGDVVHGRSSHAFAVRHEG